MTVLIYDGDHIIVLDLDMPPQQLRERWIDERTQYYQRLEPNEAPRDMPPPVLDYKINKVRLRGTASDEAWKIIYGDFDLDTYRTAANVPSAGPHDTQEARHAHFDTIISAPIHRHEPFPAAGTTAI